MGVARDDTGVAREGMKDIRIVLTVLLVLLFLLVAVVVDNPVIPAILSVSASVSVVGGRS